MKRRYLAAFLVAACMLLFVGCSTQAKDLAGTLSSAVYLRDFSFHDVMTFDYSDAGVSGTISDLTSSAGQKTYATLDSDQLAKLSTQMKEIRTVVFDGSTNTSRDQIYVKITTNYATGDPDVTILKINKNHYQEIKNGTVEVSDGQIPDSLMKLLSDLTLLGSGSDGQDLMKALLSIVGGDNVCDIVNVTENSKTDYTLNFDSSKAEDRDHFVKAMTAIFTNLGDSFTNEYKGELDSLKSGDAGLLSVFGQTPDDLQALKDSAGQDGFEENLDKSLGKLWDAGKITFDGNLKANESDYSMTAGTTLKFSCLADIADHSGSGSDTCKELYFALKNDLTIHPIVVDAQVVTPSITTAAADINVTMTSDATTVERGIVWGVKSDLSDGKTMPASKNASGNYADSLSGLTPATVYYYRGYAVDQAGFTTYGRIKSFKTLALPAVVSPTATGSTTPNPKTSDTGADPLILSLLFGGSSVLLLSALGMKRLLKKKESDSF